MFQKLYFNQLIVVLVIVTLLLLWQVSATLSPALNFVLPSPTSVSHTLITMRDRFLFHTWVTAQEMLCGFALALSAAFPLAWCMFRYQTMRWLLQPFFVLIQCLPMFTLAPLMVIWFGWGFIAIVIPTALMIFFPLTLNLYQGLRATPQPLVEFFRLNGATSWQTLIKLRLPAALPHIFSGLRLSAAIAGIGAVAGEWAGAQNGLGILMLESRRNSDLEITFGALFCLAILTFSLYSLTLLGEACLRARKRFFILILIPLLSLSALTGCTQRPCTTLLLDWLPNPNHIPLYVGLEKGYFAEEGIHLSIQKMFDNGGGVSYLVNGKADLLLAHLPGTLKATSRGADLRLVATLIPCPLRALIYNKQLPISQPSDLTDYRLGYCIGGPDKAFLEYLLAQGNIVPGSQKNVSADLVAAIGTHAVDFIYGGFWNIEPYQIASCGVETHYFPIEAFHIPSYQELLVIANGTHSQITPAFAAAFRRALQRAIFDCQRDPEAAFAIYRLYNPDKSNKTMAWEHAAWQSTYPLFPASQDLDIDQITHFYAWQLNQHILPHPIDLRPLTALYPSRNTSS